METMTHDRAEVGVVAQRPLSEPIQMIKVVERHRQAHSQINDTITELERRLEPVIVPNLVGNVGRVPEDAPVQAPIIGELHSQAESLEFIHSRLVSLLESIGL